MHEGPLNSELSNSDGRMESLGMCVHSIYHVNNVIVNGGMTKWGGGGGVDNWLRGKIISICIRIYK